MTSCFFSVDIETLAALPRWMLQPNDALVVSAGGRSLRTLETTVKAARTYGLTVHASCSPKRLQEIQALQVDRILIDWEPSTVGGWDWDPAYNLERMDYTLDNQAGLLVTGIPLNPRKRIRWDYEALSDSYAPMIVQTQGFIYRSPLSRLMDKLRGNTPFETACAELFAQHAGSASKLSRVGFQVALNGDAAVSPQTAVKAVRVANRYGINNVYVFGMNAAANRRFLELLRG